MPWEMIAKPPTKKDRGPWASTAAQNSGSGVAEHERAGGGRRKGVMSQKAAAEMLARGLSSLAKYAAVVGVGGSALAASLYNVDGGERAVLFDRFRGVLPEASEEGTHFLVPWVQTAHIMDVRVRPRLIPSATGTKDLQMVGSNSNCDSSKNARSLGLSFHPLKRTHTAPTREMSKEGNCSKLRWLTRTFSPHVVLLSRSRPS